MKANNKIAFSNKEELFLARVMRPFRELTKANPDLYYNFVEKVMNAQLNGIISDEARELVESIVYKLAMHTADQEFEKMLLDPAYGEIVLENTKAASFANMRNLTDKHKQIIEMLKKYPESSRRDLAQLLCWPINRVTPRVLELIQDRKVEAVGTKWDATTERNVQILKVI